MSLCPHSTTLCTQVWEGGSILGQQGAALLLSNPYPFLWAWALSFLVGGLLGCTCTKGEEKGARNE